ncbi:MAG: hypothetical protein IT303_05170 [Dehalococcoidia bacterium]|nr:hypothetical protein [Dehalococcoidia bacterium]
MAAPRYQSARFAIAGVLAASVIAGTVYFAEAAIPPGTGAAEGSTSATIQGTPGQAAPQATTARRSRSS